MTNTPSILVVDDEKVVRDSLTKWFLQDGYDVESADSGAEALKRLQVRKRDLILLDIKMPGMDGMELQQRVKEIDSGATIIFITAHATIDSAVQALKQGAFDYVTKPVDPDYLSHVVANALRQRTLAIENERMRDSITSASRAEEIVGESPQMKKLFELIDTVAKTDTTVMIRGESGTGKELVARAIHANSNRRFFPVVPVNCGGLAEGLLESELFGHERGAFTGAHYRRKGKLELADGGTLFLDEVGNISAKTQMDLLRVLETKQFTRVGGNDVLRTDFRVVCATNSDLEQAVKQGTFREDLYYRLNVFSIVLPPLRERRSDIPLLANYFVKKYALQMNKAVTGLAPDAMEQVVQYSWPGNVRELENAIERAMVLGTPPMLKASDLPFQMTNERGRIRTGTLADIERAYVTEVLERNRWNISRSAEELDIDRVTLYHKIDKYGLKKPS
ncbi:MAG: sigma-54 dependent transcriptional regulator [Bacteroidetes bacterium]|jgi:DNA-binding NtrC family response regulator|nr:sigma-54 dependent transcriptional regulator [Bacteroidota bacterium]